MIWFKRKRLKVLLLMSKKVPIIKGALPDNEYDLDNKSDLLRLGLDSNTDQKIADKYVHYKNCQYAIVEFKSSTLRKALDQLETTAKRLMSIGKGIDFSIIVIHRLSSWEKRIFKRGRDKLLRDPQTGNP